MHPRWFLQLHASETNIEGTEEGAVRPPQEKAPLTVALPGTTLPLQGSTAGPREEEVEGSRTLRKILKVDEMDPPNFSP